MDYCFCIGKWDRDRLIQHNLNLKNRVFPVGIPSNDGLKKYEKNPVPKKHVLVVAGWTGPPNERFEPMTEESIESSGVYQLAHQSDLPVLIKEKSRPGQDYVFNRLASKRILITSDEHDLDLMVAQSRFVIGAPSTLLFKPLQLHIPTAVLGRPYCGQYGVFEGFEGLTDSSAKSVFETIKSQKSITEQMTAF